MNGPYGPDDYGWAANGRSYTNENELLGRHRETAGRSLMERSLRQRRQEQASLYCEDAPSFGSDNFQDPLNKQLKTPPSIQQREDKPGVQFCSSHDEISAKIAAFDNPVQEPRIEIAPGITARLRGAKETYACVENDFYLPVTCFCCSTDLCCIMDANYVLCPQCRVVSPIEGCSDGSDGGVGLGFTFDDLRQWQYEILVRQQRSGAGAQW